MADMANVLCVGGTTSNDTIFYAVVMNWEVGTNWGPNTIDMSAPAMDIYTTNLPSSENDSFMSAVLVLYCYCCPDPVAPT